MAFCQDLQKEWRLAKRQVISAIRLFGPDNITSSLDGETFSDKLDQITSKLGVFIEKSQEVIDELEELRQNGAETEQEIFKRVEEVNSVTEVIIKKKNYNESNVKKKMEEVINECKLSKNAKIVSNEDKTDKSNSPPMKPAFVKLSDRIGDYCEIGPFLTHRPQFLVLANYILKQYQQTLPTLGVLMKPVLVGGIMDHTAGTLTAPDLDFSMQWDLDEALTSHLVIMATDQGESGQYTLQVMPTHLNILTLQYFFTYQILEGHVNEFKSLFQPFVIDIHSHGSHPGSEADYDKVIEAYLEEDGKTFICSDLFRGQLGMIVNCATCPFASFTTEDFSPTGAARSISVDVKKIFKTCFATFPFKTPENFQHIFERFVDENLHKILPEIDVDWTPVFTIPYMHLPQDLTIWEERDSWLLDPETRENIKQAKLVLVAKSMEEGNTSRAWRLSVNSAPVMDKIRKHFNSLHPMCSVRKVLRLIKDLKNVALEGKEKDFLKSYNVRQALIWSIDDDPNIRTEEDILISTLNKIIKFYQKENFPSFLEPKRNLIFKMSKNRLCKVGEERVTGIFANLDSYMSKVKEVQAKHQEGVYDVRKMLSPVAPFLQFPAVSDSVAEKVMERMDWFSDVISGRKRLKLVIKDYAKACLVYMTYNQDVENEEVTEEDIEEDNVDEEMPCSLPETMVLVNSITAAIPTNNQATIAAINNVAAAIAPAIEESIPAVNPVLENINHIINNWLWGWH